jgi:hypothetical protein
MSQGTTAEPDLIAEEQSRSRRRRLAILAFIAAFVLASIVSYRVLRILFAIGWLAWCGGAVDWDINASNWRRSGATSVSFAARSSFSPGRVKDADLRSLKELHHLESLDLANCIEVTDDGLAALSGLVDLKELDLSRNPDILASWFSNANPNAKLTDAALVHVGALPRLTSLVLSGNQITDAGLARLSGLGNLETLELDDTPVTDAGLQHLKGLKRLKALSLLKTKVTTEGAMALQKAIPGLVITLKDTSAPSPP